MHSATDKITKWHTEAKVQEYIREYSTLPDYRVADLAAFHINSIENYEFADTPEQLADLLVEANGGFVTKEEYMKAFEDGSGVGLASVGLTAALRELARRTGGYRTAIERMDKSRNTRWNWNLCGNRS